MRLIKNVARLESAAVLAARAQEAPRSIGVVWSEYENKVDVYTLGDDEFLAVDVTVRDREPTPDAIVAVNAEADAERAAAGLAPLAPTPERWLIHERVTRDPNDLGSVRDAAGALLGWIVRLDGSLISWEPIAAAGLGAA